MKQQKRDLWQLAITLNQPETTTSCYVQMVITRHKLKGDNLLQNTEGSVLCWRMETVDMPRPLLAVCILLVGLVALTTQRTMDDFKSSQCIPKGTSFNCTCQFDAKLNGTEINCKGLQITSFPTDFILPAALQGHPIVGLELGMNKISHLEAGVLDKYPELAYLILDNNEIDFIDDNVFPVVEKLDILVLKDNPSLTKLPKLDIALEELDVSNTSLNQSPQPLVLSGLPGVLKDLYLDNNNLETWPVEFPSSLQMLSMKGNLLTTVDDTGDDFRRLGELYLDNNQFEKLDESVSSLPEGLVILSMNYNPIRSIDNDYFHNLHAIKTFSLSHTHLSDIARIAFQGSSPKYTEDEDVELAFEYNGNLHQVYKETFDPFFFSEGKYKSLTIKLTGSTLDCTCQMIWIPELIANFSKMGLSPSQVYFEGACTLPAELSGRSLSSLKTSEIHCNVNPHNGGDEDEDNPAKNAAIVLGVILALVCIACIGYFLYDRYYKNTYMTI